MFIIHREKFRRPVFHYVLSSRPRFHANLGRGSVSINLVAQCKNWRVTIAKGHEFHTCITERSKEGKSASTRCDDIHERNEDFALNEKRSDGLRGKRKMILHESSCVRVFTHLAWRVNKFTSTYCICTVRRMRHDSFKRKQLINANGAPLHFFALQTYSDRFS